jgi:hypothetical protein
MKTEYLKELHDLQHNKSMTAEALRLAIEVIFRRDYWETKYKGKSKNRDQWVSECLLQDDLEDLEKRLDYLTKNERNGKNEKGEEEKTKNNTN